MVVEEGEIEETIENSHSSSSTSLPADVVGALVRQVEHYFSDDNLSKDDFLRSKMDDNSSVSVAIIAGFARVKALRPRDVLEKDWEELFARAIKENSTVVDVDVNIMKLRRAEPLPPLKSKAGGKRQRGTQIIIGSEERDPDRCVFVGGLSNEVTELLLFELFSQVGPVQRVTLPRDNDAPSHKGFAFVQFADGPVNSAHHSVAYAIRVMQDVMLHGRYLSVRRSNSGAARVEPLAAAHVRPGEFVERPI